MTSDEIRNIITSIGAVIAIVAALWKLPPMILDWWHRRKYIEISGEAYSDDDIRRYTRNYIQPDCQSVDPAGLEDFRCIVPAREPLFKAMDRILQSPGSNRFLIILADSGMGKTAFLLNYYARHRLRWWWQQRGLELKLVPLNQANADAMIAAIPEANRKKTVLCLDALDEDQKAIADHKQRLLELIGLSKDFRSVVITCRSQFFPKEEEIPTDTGVITALPTSGSRVYSLQKLYLAPFTDQQVDSYLRRRYRWGRRLDDARKVVSRMPDLVARPLLLTYVEDLTTNKDIKFAFQMYEMVIQNWCQRGADLVAPDKLREFSDRLAVEIFLTRSHRQMERIPEAELQPLALQFNVDLEAWKLRGRSLLNRDAAGNYKFSHRSILEYLFVHRFMRGLVPPHDEPWTDLMRSFLLEMLQCQKTGIASAIATQIQAKTGPWPCLHPKDGLTYICVPTHVNKLDAFWISQTPVTVSAYRRFENETGRMPSYQPGKDNHPAVNVSWCDAVAYCQWAGGRLPSDVEWVYAALAGGTTDPYGPLDEIAWHLGNSKGATHPVGQLMPNAWGLFDTLGNVWEWCADLYRPDWDAKVLRGGSFVDNERYLRAGYRFYDGEPGYRYSDGKPVDRYSDVGFRCLRELI